MHLNRETLHLFLARNGVTRQLAPGLVRLSREPDPNLVHAPHASARLP